MSFQPSNKKYHHQPTNQPTNQPTKPNIGFRIKVSTSHLTDPPQNCPPKTTSASVAAVVKLPPKAAAPPSPRRCLVARCRRPRPPRPRPRKRPPGTGELALAMENHHFYQEIHGLIHGWFSIVMLGFSGYSLVGYMKNLPYRLVSSDHPKWLIG